MLIITSKLPWRRQPTAPVRVNWAHPLAQGLLIYHLPADAQLLNLAAEISGTGGNESSRSGFTHLPVGNEVVLDRSTDSGIITLTSPAIIEGLSALTVCARSSLLSIGSSKICTLRAGTNSTNRHSFLQRVVGAIDTYITGSNYRGIASPGDTVFDHLAVTFDAGTLRHYVNGIFTANTRTGGTIPTTLGTSLTNLVIGTTISSGATIGLGYISPPLVYNRALSDHEIFEVFNNPYQMLAPTYSRRYFIPLVGGGPQTIAVTTGNETGVGYTLGTIQPRTIGLATGSETGTGYALSITQPRSIAFTAGSETGVGYQLGLVQPRAIGLINGQETGIGYALGTIQPRAIGFATGSETGIGYSLGVSAGGARTIDVTAGTETGTGYSLGVIQPRTIGLTAGNETGVGYSLGVSAGGSRTIDLTVGSETGLGYSFGVIQPRTVEFATGAETGIGYSLTIVPPGPILSITSGTEIGIGYALGVIQRGRKYRYPRPTKAIHTRHYTGRL